MKDAVLLPGLGYTFDRPLLYYSKKLLLSAGYAVHQINYGELPPFDANVPLVRRTVLEKAYQASKTQVESLDLDKAESVVFIGKSIGTVCLSRLVQSYSRRVKCVLFTPLQEAVEMLVQPSIVFWGTEDPLIHNQALEALCNRECLQSYKIQGANHSLETGNVDFDIETLRFVIAHTREFLSL